MTWRSKRVFQYRFEEQSCAEGKLKCNYHRVRASQQEFVLLHPAPDNTDQKSSSPFKMIFQQNKNSPSPLIRQKKGILRAIIAEKFTYLKKNKC